MANRMQKNHRALAYAFIVERDGEYCLECYKAPPHVKLEIDHADNDHTNNDPPNLHLLCCTHNLAKRKMTVPAQKRHIKRLSAKNERKRENEPKLSPTHKVRAVVDYSTGSTEMQASAHFETTFRDWVLEFILEFGAINKSEAINSGAETVGCSSVASRRYLQKMTSAAGALEQTQDQEKRTIIVLKKQR